MEDAFYTPHKQSLSSLPGQNIALIGVGGGSDGIQAAQVGMLMQANGKNISCIVSVRGSDKNLANYVSQISQDVFHINAETKGVGRFHEPRLANQVRMLVAYDTDNLMPRIMAAIDAMGGADTVFLVDTGGDALYSYQDHVGEDTTPDKDLRVLSAFANGYKTTQFYTMVIAPGIDSPPEGPERLVKANAVCCTLSDEEKGKVLANYQEWKMDGSTDELIGKTPLAWQAALRGQFGENILPLPVEYTQQAENAWNPKVNIVPSMADIFVMKLHDHLKIIS